MLPLVMHDCVWGHVLRQRRPCGNDRIPANADTVQDYNTAPKPNVILNIDPLSSLILQHYRQRSASVPMITGNEKAIGTSDYVTANFYPPSAMYPGILPKGRETIDLYKTAVCIKVAVLLYGSVFPQCEAKSLNV